MRVVQINQKKSNILRITVPKRYRSSLSASRITFTRDNLCFIGKKSFPVKRVESSTSSAELTFSVGKKRELPFAELLYTTTVGIRACLWLRKNYSVAACIVPL